jgi:hypothetical protein
MFLRERTAFPVVLYGLYLAFLGLSFRAVSSALRPFVLCGCLEVGSESYTPVDVGFSLFLVDETAVMVGGFFGMGLDDLRTLQQEDPRTMALMD